MTVGTQVEMVWTETTGATGAEATDPADEAAAAGLETDATDV